MNKTKRAGANTKKRANNQNGGQEDTVALVCDSEDKFKVLFEMSPYSIFLETLQGKIIDCNGAAVRMTGYPKKELLKMEASDLVPKKVRKLFPGIIRQELTKRTFHLQTENQRKNGGIFPVDVLGRVVDINKRKYVLVKVEDITEKRQQIKRLEESEEFFRLIFSDISDGILVANQKTKKLFTANPAMEKMLGMKLAEIQKLGVEDLHPKNEMVRVGRQFVEMTQGIFNVIEDLQVIRKDGTLFFADVRAYPLNYKGVDYAVGMFEDATEKHIVASKMELAKKKNAILDQIIRTANEAESLPKLLNTALLLVLKILDFDGGGVYLLDKEKKRAEVVESHNLPKKFLQAVKIIDVKKKPYDTIFIKGELIVSEFANELSPRAKKFSNYKSLVSVPLIAGKQVIGALNVASERRPVISPEIRAVLALVGQELGGAIKKTQSVEELRQHEEQFNTVINHSLDIIFTFDRAGKIIFITPNVAQLGYDVDEVIGKPFKQFVHREDVFRLNKELRRVIKTKKVFYTTLRLVRKDGTLVYFEEYGTPVFDGPGRFSLYTGTLRDITERIKVEEERKNYTERLRVMFEDAPDAYYLSDLRGVLVDGNKAAERLLGQKKEDLIGRSFFNIKNLIVKGQKEKVLRLLARNIRGESTGPDEFDLYKSDGSIVEAEISTHPVIIEGKSLVLGIARDITEHKQTERDLAAERDHAKQYMDIVNAIVVAIDKNHKVTTVNKKACEVLGYRADQIIGRDWFKNFIPERLHDEVLGVFKKIMSGKMRAVEHFENPIVTKGGEERVIDWHNSYFRDSKTGQMQTLSAGEDVTDRKLAEQELVRRMDELEKTKTAMLNVLEDMQGEKKLSESLAHDMEKFKLAVEGVSEHIIITDIDANIIFANHAAEAATGFKINEMIGKNPGILWGGQMDKDFYKKMWNTIKKEKKNYSGELTNKTKSGEFYTAEIHIAPILNKEGKVVFFVGIERDITKAKEVDKMKTEFISVASHQLRTPLTTVKWYAELLLAAQNDLNKKATDYVHKIYDSNQKMIRLVNDLLNVSRIESGKKFMIEKKTADIIPIIRRAAADQGVLADQTNIKIDIDGLPKKLVLNIDSEKIYQVFQNLLNNAVKYSRSNSKVEVGYQKGEDGQILTVRDHGLGIPASQQDRVFEKFFRADNVVESGKGGSGLGLYIARAIVEGHNGRLRFESSVKEGTTFYVQLPK